MRGERFWNSHAPDVDFRAVLGVVEQFRCGIGRTAALGRTQGRRHTAAGTTAARQTLIEWCVGHVAAGSVVVDVDVRTYGITQTEICKQTIEIPFDIRNRDESMQYERKAQHEGGSGINRIIFLCYYCY